MAGKQQIVNELGERALLLPNLVNEALAANERAKYLISLLQAAKGHADHPDAGPIDLTPERLACGIADTDFDGVVERCCREEHGQYSLPYARRIYDSLLENVRQMLLPLEIDGTREKDGGGRPAEYEERLAALLGELPPPAYNRVAGDAIERIAAGKRGNGDSLHLLVMDLHKGLNCVQRRVASESIAGAFVYGLAENDRALVAAFMAGVHQTEPLKFDHPGLGTTATRNGHALVLQNDVGLTDAHVFVMRVEPNRVTLTYTDVHIQRLAFFQTLFRPFSLQWDDTVSKRAAALEQGLYRLCVGTYPVSSQDDLLKYLTFAGSRLVFLIDWNRARKRLRKLAPKEVGLEVLEWAAANNYGHMGFLKLGGEQLVFDALQLSANAPLKWGGQLSDVLGAARAASFLKFTLQTTAEGLLAGRSELLIRDEIRAELRHYLDSVYEGLLELAGEHAALIVELAMAARDCLRFGNLASDHEYLERCAQRAKLWEHRADELVNRGRAARNLRGEVPQAIVEVVRVADDAADELEEAIFLLSLLPFHVAGDSSLAALEEMADLLVQGAREYLKAVENARHIHRGSSRDRVEDFLEAVDHTMKSEHQADDAHRRAKAGVISFAGDFRQLHLFTEIADNLEQAADALMRSALMLRDYVLGEAITR